MEVCGTLARHTDIEIPADYCTVLRGVYKQPTTNEHCDSDLSGFEHMEIQSSPIDQKVY